MILYYSWAHDLESDTSRHLISIAGALSSLPSLKTLVVEIDGPLGKKVLKSTLPPLRNFKNLCTLSVSCHGDMPRAYCLQEIATAINASPSLANLSIRNTLVSKYRHPMKKCTSLQHFLQTSRLELVQLELEHVPLPGTGIREILSHKLQQLSVSTIPGARRIDFDWRRLWSALQETRIGLLILKVSGTENAMDQMFTYLLSYTGLRRLEIPDVQMDTQEIEDRAARRFWNEIIPHHRNSLTELFIASAFESEWCYGPHASAALELCLSLQDLSISVCDVNLTWAVARLSRAREYDKIEFRGLEEPYNAPDNCGVRLADNRVS
jgi:hypothetical protein